MINTLVFRNWTTLAITAYVVTLFISLFYFELSTFLATITVSGLFIFSEFKSLKSSMQLRTFHFHPFLMQQRFVEIAVGILFFIFCMLKSLVFISFISIIQRVFFKDEGAYVSLILDSHWVISGLGVILATCLAAHMAANSFEKHKEISLDDQRRKMIDGYHLDYHKTYFFLMNNKIIGFMIGNHSFEVDLGLKIGRRQYKPAIVLEYLEIAGIGFQDLDEGHVKNIEMYSIGS